MRTQPPATRSSRRRSSRTFVASGSTVLAYGAGKSVGVLVVKDWSEAVSAVEHKKPVNEIVFGADAKTIFSVGDDRAMKIWKTQ